MSGNFLETFLFVLVFFLSLSSFIKIYWIGKILSRLHDIEAELDYISGRHVEMRKEVISRVFELSDELENSSNRLELSLISFKEVFEAKLIKLTDELQNSSNRIDRSVMELRENLDSHKPISTNNWDSVKKAFKRPSQGHND